MVPLPLNWSVSPHTGFHGMPEKHITLVAGPDTPYTYTCLFCGEPIAPEDPRLLPLTVIAGGQWQRFFSHRECLRDRAHPRLQPRLDRIPVPRSDELQPPTGQRRRTKGDPTTD
jgi:hypothetical protein